MSACRKGGRWPIGIRELMTNEMVHEYKGIPSKSSLSGFQTKSYVNHNNEPFSVCFSS